MSGQVAFQFSKKIERKVIRQDKYSDVTDDVTPDVDVITEVGRSGIKSLKPEKPVEEVVIPLIRTNRWQVKRSQFKSKPVGVSTNDPVVVIEEDELSRLAREALIKEAAQENDQWKISHSEIDEIPLLFANSVPEGFETEDRLDVSLRPEEPDEVSYDAVPIEAFGKAMLRGMGWHEGQGIGKSTKDKIVDIKQPTLRPKGLGLGAQIRKDQTMDPSSGKSDKTGDQLTLRKRAYVKIIQGPKRSMYAKVESFDEDNARIVVKLALGGALVTISRYGVEVVLEDEYEKESKCLNKSKYDRVRQQQEDDLKKLVKNDSSSIDVMVETGVEDAKKRTLKNAQEVVDISSEWRSRSRSASSSGSISPQTILNSLWIYPDLRVRIVDKRLKNGRCFNMKAVILDVEGINQCTCRTDDGKLVEGISQNMLETVVPKSESAHVMILRGDYRRELGVIIERNKKKCTAIVRLKHLEDDQVISVDYDDICEFCGIID